MKSFLRAKEILGRYKRSWLVPDVIWLFPVMWKNGVGLKHKGKEEKEWKMQNEQNKKRISMIWKYSRIKKENIYCIQSKTYLEYTSGLTNVFLPTHIYSFFMIWTYFSFEFLGTKTPFQLLFHNKCTWLHFLMP